MANIITCIRMIASVVLLFYPALSSSFYVFYLIAGISDMIDGAVARRTNTVSEFGSRLDTIADFVFVVVCFIKLLPLLNTPVWIYVWIAVIALIKLTNIILGYVIRKKLVAAHTIMNKVTGVILFVFPLTFSIISLEYSATVVCAVATFAAIQEGYFIWTEYFDRNA